MRAPFFAVLLPEPDVMDAAIVDTFARDPYRTIDVAIVDTFARDPYRTIDVADHFAYAQAFSSTEPIACGRCGLRLTISRERGPVCVRCDFPDQPRRAA